ncbi:electron transport complex subunit RsxC [Neiella marina]|uniref:Ion-translocating oxidoreductase complex subunit C n=1 Tax=Neiella holothuriorum TaxID=2870530 RepID=A0ABS7EHZ3_9GAMM|nr:electron transport complex subunit RsxC [Neiella holothuriorum]MBW8191967.1 electron transport complex subunit RsxC [Neiella holothuriorum]
MLGLRKKPFSGGIHPRGHKELTENTAIVSSEEPRRVCLSLQQRNGVVLRSHVNVGDTIVKGQLVASGPNDMCVPLHAPINGVVEAIQPHVSAHPSGLKTNTLMIKGNGDPTWGIPHVPCDTSKLTPEEIIQRVLDAGIVGLGGAGFPSGLKLRFARQKGVKTLLLNGGECEPYLTCDDRLMREKAAEIAEGAALMVRAIGCEQAIIAIEDNKPDSISTMQSAVADRPNLSVQIVPSLYPMGSERHLIKAVTGHTVPPGQLSTEIGILVHNVATAQAVFEAVRYQRPLIRRVMTISGGALEQPTNLIVAMGTLVSDLIARCGGLKMEAARLVAGGPMMGQVLPSPFVPIDKSIGGILALSADEIRAEQSHDCVRCGRCVNACPMGLMPFQMAAHSRVSDLDGARHFGLDNCLLCGACSYVCPSRIPLVQYFQHARSSLNASRTMERKSAHARQLTEARQARLMREAEAKKAAKAARSKTRKRPARTPRKKADSTDSTPTSN